MAVNSANLFPVGAHKGSLFMITPEEQAHAILLKVAYHVLPGSKHHRHLRLVLLSVPVYIDVIPKRGAGAVSGPECQASHIAISLDYGANSATTMLRCGRCQEHIADHIGSVADKEGDQRQGP